MFKAIQKGFTLIEFMIIAAIIGILAAVALPFFFPNEAHRARQERAIQEIRNPIQSQCLNGYAYVTTPQGTQQTLNENGTGVRCG